MAQFLHHLGYKAIPCGNDTAVSIPYAIQAGSGELGRNGLLIIPEYGPHVRVCPFNKPPGRLHEAAR